MADMTQDKIDYIIKHYPTITAKAIAEALGCSISTVYHTAERHGIKKSDEFYASSKSGRTDGAKGQGTRFVKGHATWNKGVPGSTGTHPNCRRTQYKKGNMSGAAQHNYAPIGSHRITKDGYLEVKVTDDHQVPARRWVALHRIVWERENGKVPDGHVVVFKLGMKTTIPGEVTIDRLDCISRAENMKRNTIHRYPSEVKDAIRAITKLNKGIRNHEQNNN